jgi:hypothetical protein
MSADFENKEMLLAVISWEEALTRWVVHKPATITITWYHT